MDDDSYCTYSEGNTTCNATPIHVQVVVSSAASPADTHNNSSSSGSGGHRTFYQRFSNGQQQQPSTLPMPTLPMPTPPAVRGNIHGVARNPRLSSEERGGRTTAAAATTAITTTNSSTFSRAESPKECGGVAQHGNGASAATTAATTAYTLQLPARAATSETQTGVASRAAAAEVSRRAASASTVSPATLTQLRRHIAHSHGLVGQQSGTVVGGNRDQLLNDGVSSPGSSSTAAEQPKPHPPQLRPVVMAKSATVERLKENNAGGAVEHHHHNNNGASISASGDGNSSGGGGCGGACTRPSSADVSNTNLGPHHLASTHAASNDVVAPMLEPIRMEISESCNPSLMESVVDMDGDLAPPVAEACHGFLQHLPADWARAVVRAVTLQTATLQVPPRLLRAPAIFDTYAELRGEISSTLEAAAAAAKASRATTSTTTATAAAACNNNASSTCQNNTSNSSSVGGDSSANTGKKADTSLTFHTINLQRLLTIAPLLLRYRLHNTRTTKVDELRAGFRNNVQTAARTEASVNRYAYLPHVQRDVHYGAMLSQGALRMMTPGPKLTGGTTPCSNSNAPDSGRFSPRPHAVQHAFSAQAEATTAPVLTRTYAAISFENFASLFLKDRFDVAQTERPGGGVTGDGGAGSSNNNHYRHGNRRRRRINPFFERDFVSTIATGQEEAVLFATTMAPEIMVGLPSFLKHPERAVPLSLAATLHHLYSALTMELFLLAYTNAARRNAAAAAEGVAAPHHTNGIPHPSGGHPAAVLSLFPAETSPVPPLPTPSVSPAVLRGPSLELGMLYVRNTIVCSASTPGMESYLVFLHQIVYADMPSVKDSRDGTASATAAAPPPCRALVQLSEDANGSMAAPPPPPNVRGGSSNNNGSAGPAAAGAFEMPTMKHAAVEMTQLVTWVQDVRSHDPRHGQPFSCHLTFVPTHIPDLASPTLSRLCVAHPVVMEDANAFPCAVVQGTSDLWKALPPPEVSNLLRIFYVLDRHAQRVMELESPDYGTEEEAAAAAAAAAAAKTRDIAEEARSPTEAMNPVSCAIPYPDPQVRQRVASTVEEEVRAYVEGIDLFRREASTSSQLSLQQRLVSFFMARLRYYEDLNERHCKTEEELQKAELQRMAQQRAQTAATPQQMSSSSPPMSPPPQPTLSSSTPRSYDAYEVRSKALGDALAVALAAEAVAVSSERAAAAPRAHTRSASGGGAAALARAGVAHGLSWLREPAQPGTDSLMDLATRDGENVVVPAPSVVVLLVPQRDVQRR
jgi:hypothetical protein